MFGDADGNVGPFLSLVCPGHRDYIGRGKPPPPLVPPVRHAGALASAARVEYCHLPVRQGGRDEAPTDGRGGDAGDGGEGLPGLWKTA